MSFLIKKNIVKHVSLSYCSFFYCIFFDMMNKDTNSMNRQMINKDIQFTALQSKLQNGLYGQHLAADIVSKHLKFHMTRNPSKALALSFHGGPGTGKNYVSTILADNIFKKEWGASMFIWYLQPRNTPTRIIVLSTRYYMYETSIHFKWMINMYNVISLISSGNVMQMHLGTCIKDDEWDI